MSKGSSQAHRPSSCRLPMQQLACCTCANHPLMCAVAAVTHAWSAPTPLTYNCWRCMQSALQPRVAAGRQPAPHGHRLQLGLLNASSRLRGQLESKTRLLADCLVIMAMVRSHVDRPQCWLLLVLIPQ
jgi:hypothetical protein